MVQGGATGEVGIDHHRRHTPFTGGIDPGGTVPGQCPGLQNREAAHKDAIRLTDTKPVAATGGTDP